LSGRRILRGVGASWFLTLSRALVNLSLVPLFYAYLPKPVLGAWLAFAALANFVHMSDPGLSFVAIRALAFHRGRRDHGTVDPDGLDPQLLQAKPADLVHTVSGLYWRIALVLVAASAGFGWWYLGSTGLDPAALPGVRGAWLVYAVGFAVTIAGQTPNLVLQGLGDVGLDSAFQAVALWLGLAANLACLKAGFGIFGLACVYLVQGSAVRLGLWWMVKARHAWVLEGRGRYQRALAKVMLVEGRGMLMTQLGNLLTYQAAPLALVWSLGPQALPDYNSLWVLALYGNQVGGALGPALIPFIVARRAQGDAEGIRRLHSLCLKCVLGFQVLWAAFLLAGAPVLLQLWIGPGHFVGWGILALFITYNFLDQQQAAHGYFAWTAKRWPFGRWTLAAGLLTGPLVLAGVAWLGLPGAALGALTAQLLTNDGVVVKRTLDIIQVPWTRYLGKVLLRVLLLGALLALAGFTARDLCAAWAWPAVTLRGVGLDRVGPVAAAGLAAGLAALALGWGFLLDGVERAWVAERWRAWRKAGA
jgi:O-antigen/teichoic acid export membrane protein